MKSLPAAGRDQEVSPFAASLSRLCDGLPAVAAALVDAEGETVDYSGRRAPFDIRVTAAELRLILGLCREANLLCPGGPTEFTLRAQRASYAAFGLEEGYALIVELPRRAFAVSRRALAEGVRALCVEAQLAIPAHFLEERWTRIDVKEETGGTRRPTACLIAPDWLALEVLGRYRDQLSCGAAGYRVRADNGLETNLVRESFGRWYTDLVS